MLPIVRARLIRYGLAMLIIGPLAGLKMYFDPLIGEKNPFLLFLAGIMLTAWIGGLGPGLVATSMAALASDWLFLTPGQMVHQNPLGANIQLALFFVEGALISWGTSLLRRALIGLKEADRHKDNFLGVLAHELRNHMTPIHYCFRGIQMSSGDPVLVERAAEVIDRQVQLLARLIDDLLDLARIREGKIRLCLAPTDIRTVVKDAIETSRPLIESLGHDFTVTLPQETLSLNADASRLAQAVANLLNNAAKYTKEGGRIGLLVERGKSEVQIRVRDSGMGIPAELLPKVFDLFHQVDATLHRSQGGLGIGLSLVRQVVLSHGGTVEAFSKGPGQGSEFLIRLPLLLCDPPKLEKQTFDGNRQITRSPSDSSSLNTDSGAHTGCAQ
jgi:signal transduction histidine kinase